MLVVGDLRYYRVETTLDGGMRLSIRATRPDDKERLVEHFERLSLDSQYRRFFGFRKAFTRQELEYMTNPNFLEHATIVVTVCDSEMNEYIVGEGHYVAVPDGQYAKFALSVLDQYQRKGIGSLLLPHLARLARHWGVRKLQADVLSSNRNALSFLVRRGFRSIGTSASVHRLSRSLACNR
jgi:GNAT superfamily N-acetyltransferase